MSHCDAGVPVKGHGLLGQEVSGEELRGAGAGRHWGKIPGAERRGAGGQWGRTSWGRTSGAGSRESQLSVKIKGPIIINE